MVWRGGGVISGGIGDERGAYRVSLLGGLSAAAASVAASLLAHVVDFFLCNETVRNCEKKEKKGGGGWKHTVVAFLLSLPSFPLELNHLHCQHQQQWPDQSNQSDWPYQQQGGAASCAPFPDL